VWSVRVAGIGVTLFPEGAASVFDAPTVGRAALAHSKRIRDFFNQLRIATKTLA